MSLSDLTVRDLLTAFAVRRPTPAGGSASALVSAIGVSILMKAAAAAKLPTDPLADLQRQLTDAIDADDRAFAGVTDARRLTPTGSDGMTIRRDARDRAMRKATDVPLTIARLSEQALGSAGLIESRVRRPLASDVRIAADLLRTGLRGALACVEANLAVLGDKTYVDAVRREVESISAAGRNR